MDLTKREIYLTSEQVAEHYRITPAALRNARYRGDGLPFIKTPTGGVRYRLSDILAWDANSIHGFTFAGFEELVSRLSFLDQNQKSLLMRAMNARFRPGKKAE
jgi:hypothetical protein